MVICKLIDRVNATIMVTEGYGKKGKKLPLYSILIPSQKIAYDLIEKKLIESPLELEVTIHALEKPSFFMRNLTEAALEARGGVAPETEAKGNWSLETFSDFVDGVKDTTNISKQYLEKNLDLIGESKITETTYVWSICKNETVSGGGVFSKDEHDIVQKISFSILGLESGFVRWENDMLDSIISMKENITKQISDFENKIIGINNEE